ncbi:hypothetical protein SAMN06297358_3149 [Pedobacter xixiisoli]|uniref:Uncharacterized protein n=1 Tax=Pedobacter xixiisoli TaxID=1476464 RepID=A0A286A9Y3_9SPHI|nr:hypothetical protein SAMN06297358_3149 [Pedobacter xixiisoli]
MLLYYTNFERKFKVKIVIRQPFRYDVRHEKASATQITKALTLFNLSH